MQPNENLLSAPLSDLGLRRRHGAIGKALIVYLASGSLGAAVIAYLLFSSMSC